MIKHKLEENIYKQIVLLSNQGNALFNGEKYTEAILKFEKALSLVSEPKNVYEATTWLLTSIGDSYFFMEDYNNAIRIFYDALNTSFGLEKGFIYLRLGQSLYELDLFQDAKKNLFKAYMLNGSLIFATIERKYIEILIDNMKNPLHFFINDINSNLLIEEPLLVEKKEGLGLMKNLKEVNGTYIGFINSENNLIQFIYEQNWKIDIPVPKQKGTYQKKIDKDEIMSIISIFFDNNKIPELTGTEFTNW